MAQEKLTIHNLFEAVDDFVGPNTKAVCRYCCVEVKFVLRMRHLMYHVSEVSTTHAATMDVTQLVAARGATSVLIDAAYDHILRAIAEFEAAKFEEN